MLIIWFWIFFLRIYFVRKMILIVVRSNLIVFILMYKYVIVLVDFLDCELFLCCLIVFVVFELWFGVEGKIMLVIVLIIGWLLGGFVFGSKIGFWNLLVVNDWWCFIGGIENLLIIFCVDLFIIGFVVVDFIDLMIICVGLFKKICCIV